jgi:hypothetical protein
LIWRDAGKSRDQVQAKISPVSFDQSTYGVPLRVIGLVTILVDYLHLVGMPKMKTSADLLDAIKGKLALPSDYAAHKKLGVSKQYISRIRNGHETWSDDMCIIIAEILEVAPVLVLATVQAERTRSEPAKKAWAGIIDKLGGTAAAVAFGIMLNALPPLQPTASAAEQVQHNNAPNIHYTKRRRRNRGILSNMVEQLMQRPRLA